MSKRSCKFLHLTVLLLLSLTPYLDIHNVVELKLNLGDSNYTKN